MSIYTNSYITRIQEISLPNKYTKWYCRIVHRSQERASTQKQAKELCGYVEGHHILPKSFKLGGEKDKSNIAYLTAREHFICHLLLMKMIEGRNKAKMALALKMLIRLGNQISITARTFQYIREESAYAHRISLTGIVRSDKTKAKIREKRALQIMLPVSAETCSKISKSSKNKKKSPEHIAKFIKNLDWTGRKRTEENKGKLRGPKEKVICPHCGKEGGKPVMTRYHFSNCKLKKPATIAD